VKHVVIQGRNEFSPSPEKILAGIGAVHEDLAEAEKRRQSGSLRSRLCQPDARSARSRSRRRRSIAGTDGIGTTGPTACNPGPPRRVATGIRVPRPSASSLSTSRSPHRRARRGNSPGSLPTEPGISSRSRVSIGTVGLRPMGAPGRRRETPAAGPGDAVPLSDDGRTTISTSTCFDAADRNRRTSSCGPRWTPT
jgi:hypothetical protein